MESPRKNNDCYFYYYSTCTKGDSCSFRHEPTALGCETVCSFWQQGKCINQHCNFRHMELRKNRKVIPCYWENQPGGCLKPHCPFQHKTPKESGGPEPASTDTPAQPKPQERDWNRREVGELEGGECAKPALRRVSQGSDTSYGSPAVDPLVVNFEEESDNESVPTSSPVKQIQCGRIVRVKTLEEIRLERVQAESAAYYSYPEEQNIGSSVSDDLRNRILNRMYHRTRPQSSSVDFKILSLDEIRKRKKKMSLENEEPSAKIQKVVDIKVKSLEEIRAVKRSLSPDFEETPAKKLSLDVSSTEPDSFVSSSLPVLRKTRRRSTGGEENGVQSRPKLIRRKSLQNGTKLTQIEETDEERNKINDTSRIPDLLQDCNKTQSEMNEELDTSEDILNRDDFRNEVSLLLGDSDCEDSNVDDILQNIDDILND